MIIALDYDDTYTEAPDLWSRFVEMATGDGHYIMVVTARMSNNIADIEAALPALEVIATSGRPKRQFLADHGFPDPSVWIDDMPHLI